MWGPKGKLAIGLIFGLVAAVLPAHAKAPQEAAQGRPSATALPPGHPSIGGENGEAGDDGEPDEQLPPGHPSTRGPAPAGAEEHLPQDRSNVDPALPAGTIVVEIRDGKDRPVTGAGITLGILAQSVAKGESRRHVAGVADASGSATFAGLETGTGVAYRITVPWSAGVGGTAKDSPKEPATYAASPFQLDLHRGQRVTLHVYPVTSHIEDALVGIQGILYVELKDDVVRFEELLQLYNIGTVTWVPSDVVIDLPSGFKAFNSQKQMSDIGLDPVEGRGAKLRGTFAPGQHEMVFNYQVPYDGSDQANFSFTLPPHLVRMRVMAEAARGMELDVTDFPHAIADRNTNGQRLLITEKQLRPGQQQLSRLHVGLRNLPSPGPGRWWAVAIAALTVILGLTLAIKQGGAASSEVLERARGDALRARARLVEEVAALERARAAGEIGPKTYARARQALVDTLARLMAVAES
jgi:hypothetical protein